MSRSPWPAVLIATLSAAAGYMARRGIESTYPARDEHVAKVPSPQAWLLAESLRAEVSSARTEPHVPSMKVQLRWQFRDAWLPPPLVPAFEMTIGDDATEMQIAIGVLTADPGLLWDEMQFDVVVRVPGAPERTLFRQGLTSRESARDGWHDANLLLPAGSGRQLSFRATPTHPRPHERDALQALWARPRMTAGVLPTAARLDPTPNVVLISIDTLRADHVGAYGYARPTTPAIDRMAREGVRFATAVAPSSWTTPSHMSLLTSLLPATHGLEDRPDDVGRDGAPPVFRALGEGHATLAELLHGAGYETAAFTGGDTLAGSFGFARGFERYDEGLGQLTPCSWQPLDAWLSLRHTRPFFLFVHTFEVHAPYTGTTFLPEACPRPCSQEDSARHQNVALYDGDIRTADDYVGRILARLRATGLWERTLIVLTSDHGEEFGDHDPAAIVDAHGHTLYEELLRVPLVFGGGWLGSSSTRVVPEMVQLVDVTPTILDLAQVEAPHGLAGRSLRPDLEDGARKAAATAVSELRLGDRELRSLRGQRWKYVQTATRPAGGEAPRQALEAPLREELYDLAMDPREKHDLCGSNAEECHAQRRALVDQVLAARALRRGPAPALQPTAGLLERLRALGYLK